MFLKLLRPFHRSEAVSSTQYSQSEKFLVLTSSVKPDPSCSVPLISEGDGNIQARPICRKSGLCVKSPWREFQSLSEKSALIRPCGWANPHSRAVIGFSPTKRGRASRFPSAPNSKTTFTVAKISSKLGPDSPPPVLDLDTVS